MKKSTLLVLVFAFAVMLTGLVQAQELMYGQRELQVSYDGEVSVPALVFNGEDFAAFYSWSGNEDKGIGLYMRRIGADGKPFGPQRQIMALGIYDPAVYAVWDGSAYIVFMSQFRGVSWHIFRVDVKGNMLAYKKVPVAADRQTYRRAFPFVLDDRVFFFFSTMEDYFAFNGQSYLITVDRELTETPVLAEMPTGGLQKTVTLGVALDPDKFLVYVGRYTSSISDYEIDEAALLHIDFDGKLMKKIRPAIFGPDGAGPAAKLESADAGEAAGPLYTGDGYLVFGTTQSSVLISSPTETYPYINSSAKIDDSGQVIDGPFNLGNAAFSLLLSEPVLLGRYVGMPVMDQLERDTQMMLMGQRGKHITDISVHEGQFISFFPVVVSAVYSGSNCTLVNLGKKERLGFSEAFAVYSNIITDPPFVKPSIFYFKGSEGSPFGDTRLLVMWSVASCTDVTLTGPDFEMTHLPPVFYTVVDTNGERTKLRLTIAGTNGSTKTKRLVIEP